MLALVAALLAAHCAQKGAGGPSEIEGFDGLIKAARAAMAKNDAGAARPLLERALGQSGDPPEGGPHLVKAKELLGELFLKDKKYKAASWMFRDAARFALDDSKTRTNLLWRRKAALEKAEDKKGAAFVDQIIKHDQIVFKAARWPVVQEKQRSELRSALAEAASAYRADKDPVHADFASAVRALVSVKSGAVEEGMAEARALANGKKPRLARLVALDAVASAALAQKDGDLATRTMIELNALRFDPLPEEKRRYMRIRGLDEACRKYDDDHGPGSCTRLERDLTGRYSFTDYSLGKVKRELGEADLDRAHRQFLPALEDCVLSTARANRDIFRNTDIQISWAIQPKGNASDLDISPKRYREELLPCVEQRLAWFRYPRSTSPERKTVTIPYHLD